MPHRRAPHTRGRSHGRSARLHQVRQGRSRRRRGSCGRPRSCGASPTSSSSRASRSFCSLCAPSPRSSRVTFIPRPAYVVWGVVMLTGWAMTYVYGVFVTFKARRWLWLTLCAIPLHLRAGGGRLRVDPPPGDRARGARRRSRDAGRPPEARRAHDPALTAEPRGSRSRRPSAISSSSPSSSSSSTFCCRSSSTRRRRSRCSPTPATCCWPAPSRCSAWRCSATPI